MARRTRSKVDEKALREKLDARREDMSLYTSKPARAKIGQTGTIVFSLRFSPSELEDLRLQAQARGITLSEMIRKAALDWGQSHRYQVVVPPQPNVEISVSRTRAPATFAHYDPGVPKTAA
jgi:hypothetical protein